MEPSTTRKDSFDPSRGTELSRHSPPITRLSTKLSGLSDLPSDLSSVWIDLQEWKQFKKYATNLSEGEDSDGRKMSLGRYCEFLELYAELDSEFRSEKRNGEKLSWLVENIMNHEEGFLDRERGLKVVDSGLRREILDNVRKVREKYIEPGPHIFVLMYQRVLDKLNELVGNYQNMLIEEERRRRKVNE